MKKPAAMLAFVGTLMASVLSISVTLAGGLSSEGVAAKVLKQLENCPETEPTCLTYYIYLQWPEKLRKKFTDSDGMFSANVTYHPNVDRFDVDENAEYGVAQLTVRGRLEGGVEKAHKLLLNYPTDMLNCGDFRAPVVGVSGKAGGTILTDAGRLEIIDETLQFGSRTNVDFIDKKSLTMTNRTSPSWEKYSWNAKPVITLKGGFLMRKGDRCISGDRPGLFKLVPEDQCIPLPMDRPSENDLDRVRASGIYKDKYEIERLEYDLWQPRGAPFLVNIWGVACT